MDRILFKHIDNSALIVFRVCFGLLITLEAWGSIFTGWVKRVFVEPQFTFTFIGFEFLQPLPGNWMYFFYVVMGIFGILVMIGYKYKFSMIMFTLMWTYTYLIHKTAYNNHYYLLILICVFMCLVPAHRYSSVDARLNPALKRISMPRWILLAIILQIGIVYTYASLAKIYPDWLDGTVADIMLTSFEHLPFIGKIIEAPWTRTFLTWFAILFDLSIVPLLLWKKSRLAAFILAIFFHLWNSIFLQIGIFPYLSLAFCLFFFPSITINRLFLKKKPYYNKGEIIVPAYKKSLLIIGTIWFVLQIALPVRHWFIKDDVLWTEEGHRLSWRMMLRNKNGRISIKIIHKTTGNSEIVNLDEYLTKKQITTLEAKPDVIWQFCQYLEKKYNEKGEEIEIYVDSKISVNHKPYRTFIDPKVDMAQAKWDYFFHNEWILPSEQKQ